MANSRSKAIGTDDAASLKKIRPCKLLELPAELRLTIWEAYYTTELIKEAAQDAHHRKTAMALPATCKDIFHEVHLIYFGRLDRMCKEMSRAQRDMEADRRAKFMAEYKRTGGKNRFLHASGEEEGYQEQERVLSKLRDSVIIGLAMLKRRFGEDTARA